MNRYNPDQAPDPEEWLALDEQIQIGLVEKYHRAARIKLPDLKAHAVFHVVIENQCAENLDSVVCRMRFPWRQSKVTPREPSARARWGNAASWVLPGRRDD